MGDIIENEELDKDTVDAEALEEQFDKKYGLLTEKAVSLNKSYINKLAGTKTLNFAVGLANDTLEVYKLSNTSLEKICGLSGHKETLTEVVFSPQEDHLVYSCSLDGLVKLWDTRCSGTCVLEYKDEEEEIKRPFECMDVSCNGLVFCAGSQLVDDDAYLVFWDQRMHKPLGGYWNSHTDEVTQVKFHKNKIEIMVTGSLDGLLNVFNIMEQNEDDALTYSLNVENSIEKLAWLDEKHVGCITQSNDFQLWDVEEGDLLKTYSREKIAKSIRRSKPDDCYVVDALAPKGLLAGSQAEPGDILRSVEINDKKLQPSSNFTENKQIVRSCWYDDNRELLVTTGESGIISVWRQQPEPLAHSSNKLTDSLNKLQDNRHKPY